MTLLSPERAEAVDALIRTVARDIVLPRYRNLAAEHIHEKAADDLVTIADHESEARLAEGLAAILPDARVIGEEACVADPSLLERFGDSLVWIIDPIDGTGNFAAGRPPFGILIALAADGEARAGWLYDPLTGRMCHAVAGQGAFINGEPVRARESGMAPPVAGISLLYVDPDKRRSIITRAEGRLNMVDIPRCAAEQYPRVVLGQNDLALFERTLPWDHAAGALFLTEAGGRALRPDGLPYRVDDPRPGLLAAASPRLWDMGAAIVFA
ncbi:MAG TPA: inositol monophosphatase family protein [Sphingobium sp.]|nr:inositol monophosphatase family protein [Sphingobium sp.]